jgi:hypothetical protein
VALGLIFDLTQGRSTTPTEPPLLRKSSKNGGEYTRIC